MTNTEPATDLTTLDPSKLMAELLEATCAWERAPRIEGILTDSTFITRLGKLQDEVLRRLGLCFTCDCGPAGEGCGS